MEWTNSCGGTFTPSNTAQNVTFTPPNDGSITECVITLVITDPWKQVSVKNSPIFFEEASFESTGEDLNPQLEYKNLSLQELEELLQKAVQEEDYEKAVKLRDEISKR